jgi:FMN phosphatase YigB (HAD superfamily)
MDKITKLAVFDFDGTLVDTPLPDTGRQQYREKTGKEWPHKGWWGREESLDTTIFDMPSNPSVIADYQKEKADPNTAVIMLTGRMTKLADKVKDILDSKGLTFDGYYYNRGGSTDVEKIKTLNEILEKIPSIEVVEAWDDRLEHIPTFEQWGKSKVEEGRLKDFKINVVFSGHH